MATTSTLLCIHHDPGQLTPLQKHGYELVTATNGSEGLRLLMSRSVDAIVLEYHLGLLNGEVVAEIKRVKPQLPIVMLADHPDLPARAMQSVDAVVIKSDGIHFLGATIRFVLNVKPAKRIVQAAEAAEALVRLRRRQPIACSDEDNSIAAAAAAASSDGDSDSDNDNDTPFSPGVWRSILDGSIKF
jgi:DNA-binding response OmpR family regulator